jgi:hypothetical protein
MPEANSAPILSNPPSRYPRIAPEPAQKPKLLDRLREALRSRHYTGRIKFRNGFFHLTHVDLFRLRSPSPSFLCYPFAGGGLRYLDLSGTSGAQ